MHGISTFGMHSLTSLPQGAGALSSPSGSGFLLAAPVHASGGSMGRGVSSTSSPSLGSQTISTLLQTQDLSQTTISGGGHGGGGHHGGMKMVSGIEAEETAESQETQEMHQRKKLAKTTAPENAPETAETDQSDHAGQTDEVERNNRQNDTSL